MNTRMLSPEMVDGIADQPEVAGGESPWRRHAGIWGPAVFVIFLAGFGAYKLLDPGTLPIRHVDVKGDFRHLSTTGLQQRTGDVVRGGFFNVNVETIQKVLLEEPWIRDVSVKRVWPDRITVSIGEQVAVALWNDDSLLNGNGRIFSPEINTFPEEIPRFRGPEGSHSQMLSVYQNLSSALPERFGIAEITLSDRRSWHIGFTNGPHVYLGRTNIEARLQRFVEYIPGKLGDLFNRIRSIDMRYTNGFAVRWEPEYKPDL